ncbi:hypothetical protein RKD52_003756 [Metabacillus sp. SLBN-84]
MLMVLIGEKGTLNRGFCLVGGTDRRERNHQKRIPYPWRHLSQKIDQQRPVLISLIALKNSPHKKTPHHPKRQHGILYTRTYFTAASSFSLIKSAVSWPERVTIGTPPPGWVEPPTKYRPSYSWLLDGILNPLFFFLSEATP